MLQMMTRMDLVEELVKRGYDAKPWDKVKNGVMISGILMVGKNRLSSFVVTNSFLDEGNRRGKSISKVAAEFISFYERNRSYEDFEIGNLSDKEYVLSHISIALQKPSSQLLIKRPCSYFGGTEQYLYFAVQYGTDVQMYTEVTREMLKNAGIEEEEAWERAKKNLHDNVEIKSMVEVMKEKIGADKDFWRKMTGTDEVIELDESFLPMYFMSNKTAVHGASSVLDTEVLTDFAKKHNTKSLLILPSSIHEVIIIPDGKEEEMEFMKAMVRDVNIKEVSPEERLSDTPFIWYL